jgi:transposase
MPRAGKPRRRGPNMTEEEKKVAHMMYHHQGEKPEDIAEFFGHHQSCICKILFPKKKKKKAAKTPGRPEKLSKEQIDRLVTKKDELVTKAGGKHDVTINMVKFSARSSACTKTIRKSFKARKITWKPMRSSIILSAKDKEARLKWAKKYQKKPKKFWQKAVHANIDNKWFPIYHNGKHRDYAARRSCRGAYRGPGQSLLEVYQKPKAGLKYNTGKKTACIMGGIGGGKVIMWEENSGPWDKHAAAAMYNGVLKRGLKAKYPAIAKKMKKKKKGAAFTILEDNDPTGYKSAEGKKAKKAAGIEVLSIPKRSPDLSVMDYAVWSSTNKGMREQETNWGPEKKESREAYLKRLRKTALSFSAATINKWTGDMVRRCKLLVKAKGGYIDG